MMPRLLIVLVLPLCLAAFALADDKTDLKELETGTWKLVAMNQGGKDTPKELVAQANLIFTFKGEKMTKATGTGEKDESTFKIDSSKTPKEIDLKAGMNMDKAIYVIDKDTLKIAIGTKDRPLDFKGGEGSMVVTLERVK